MKELPWSAAEEDLLEQFGHLTPSGIRRQFLAAGYSRSIAAIQVKLNRTRIKQNLYGYSASTLANAFGIDVHKVFTWIRRGLLSAQRRGIEQSEPERPETWWIPERAVRRFVLCSPEELDLARMEKIWFLDLLTGGKIGTRPRG